MQKSLKPNGKQRIDNLDSEVATLKKRLADLEEQLYVKSVLPRPAPVKPAYPESVALGVSVNTAGVETGLKPKISFKFSCSCGEVHSTVIEDGNLRWTKVYYPVLKMKCGITTKVTLQMPANAKDDLIQQAMSDMSGSTHEL
jgi:hypothetical protein